MGAGSRSGRERFPTNLGTLSRSKPASNWVVSVQKQYVQGIYKGMTMGGILRAWLVVPGPKRVGAGEPAAEADLGCHGYLRCPLH